MSKVSFTIRRPTPVSRGASSGPESDPSGFKIPALPRHLAQDSAPGSPLSRSRTSSPARYNDPDSSDEEDEATDELVTSFDAMGAQRLHAKKNVPQGPLVIPALKNRDWREMARKRRTGSQFVPESARAATGQDGSVGGLGTRDTINSGPVLSGLQKVAKVKQEDESEMVEERVEMADVKPESEEVETEDQRALRAILAGANGFNDTSPVIIPTPISEADAYKQDVDELPDAATLDDYARVPVEQFGLALLRGMGWKEGTAASRKPGKGLVQPYLPQARPALLGIGAKEKEVFDDGSKKVASKRPERRYVPVVKQETNGGSSSSRGESRRADRPRSPKQENGSASRSRRNSRSMSPGRRRHYDDDRRPHSSRRESSYDDKRRDSSRRDSGYDGSRKELSTRDYDRQNDLDSYSSRRRD
ncbi:DExH-box splicing factor binding site-domain-containing protein [Mycena pura]|uniref:DExH-box splicing factor binding site-domain-containing protein n=1 Tax=Mycena pura TaxID=153505 RepID=A0AAD6VHD8_9AGAR|nr:DExH-box splicing factor binding site-domain-containing protein [Mycena pura]